MPKAKVFWIWFHKCSKEGKLTQVSFISLPTECTQKQTCREKEWKAEVRKLEWVREREWGIEMGERKKHFQI